MDLKRRDLRVAVFFDLRGQLCRLTFETTRMEITIQRFCENIFALESKVT